MKSHLAGLSVCITTIYLVTYVILIYAGAIMPAMMMLLGAPLMLGWMVYSVIRYGKPSGRTFSEYFYDDVEWRRSE